MIREPITLIYYQGPIASQAIPIGIGFTATRMDQEKKLVIEFQ